MTTGNHQEAQMKAAEEGMDRVGKIEGKETGSERNEEGRQRR